MENNLNFYQSEGKGRIGNNPDMWVKVTNRKQTPVYYLALSRKFVRRERIVIQELRGKHSIQVGISVNGGVIVTDPEENPGVPDAAVMTFTAENSKGSSFYRYDRELCLELAKLVFSENERDKVSFELVRDGNYNNSKRYLIREKK